MPEDKISPEDLDLEDLIEEDDEMLWSQDKLKKAAKKTAIKSERIFKKGEGITERILFDDSFDWSALEGEIDATARPEEKLAELDLLEIGKAEIPEETPSALPTRPREEDEQEEPPPDASPKRSLLSLISDHLWLTGGVLALCLIIVVMYILIPPEEQELPQSPPRNVVTKGTRNTETPYVHLEPFLVPITEEGMNGFWRVTATLVIRPGDEYLIEDHLGSVRGTIFIILKTPPLLESQTYNREILSHTILVRLNELLGVRTVKEVRLFKKTMLVKGRSLTG